MVLPVLEVASPTFNGMSASLCPGFGRDHFVSLAPAVSVWMSPAWEATYSSVPVRGDLALRHWLLICCWAPAWEHQRTGPGQWRHLRPSHQAGGGSLELGRTPTLTGCTDERDKPSPAAN